jgi:hypothetical protein
MSRAFMKESDDQWLSDVAPTLSALLLYLTRENNDITVVEERLTIDQDGREIHHMSNGLAYFKDTDGRWSIAPE